MHGITLPISFVNIEVMNKWYDAFFDQAKSICRKYNVPELLDNARIYKDDRKLEVSIVSLGAYIKGSDTEKAVNEIVQLFEPNFSD